MKTQKRWSAQELTALANQLGCPTASKGLAVAKQMQESNKEMIINAFKILDIQPKDSILELGPGNGWHLSQVLKNKELITYTGLDISKLMVEEAKKNNSVFAKQRTVQFQTYNGTLLDFPAEQFNKIIAINTIYFWRDPNKIINQLYNLLQKGGSLVLGYAERKFMEQLPFTTHGFELYETVELVRILELCGFSNFALKVHTDKVLSKMGTQVERDYTVLKVTK
ncbi:class I SAM-dependent methyltransferase [Leeuwenhoekiella sp. H156]|uniref:class I SAM-dependent methyltransferase n=1 Tax=Leeuwenhoekiella sp. H156 TaxID=3450128 RepID=UPI003FA493FA